MTVEYEIIEVLEKSNSVSICRGRRISDDELVIIKKVEHDNASKTQILQYVLTEHEFMKVFDCELIPRPLKLESYSDTTQLVLENCLGVPLSQTLGSPVQTSDFLTISVQLTTALTVVHGHDIVHNDLRPSNIFIHLNPVTIGLLGFGVARRLSASPFSTCSSCRPFGSLAHTPPEQMSDTSYRTDPRSDLYSLGVIFYQLLTGILPFDATDPIGWYHCHTARLPKPIHKNNPTVPKVIAEVVLRLLAKQPNQRYQSSSGLLHDLLQCQEQWSAFGTIALSPLGKHDFSDHFSISSKLYGREKELTLLSKRYREMVTTGTTRFLLVSGNSGVGKSALIQELRHSVANSGGLFVCGKYEQYQRDLPYATFIQAVEDLISLTLSESDNVLEARTNDLKAALGNNGQLISKLIPQVEELIGVQPAVPELPPAEAQNRFHIVFDKFLSVFAKKEHPLVLFLDDLQWFDPASLKLMSHLLTQSEPRALLLIGAYRANEVDSSHPLSKVLCEMRQSGVCQHELALKPLAADDLREMIADTLHESRDKVASLSKLVHGKTAGNPFFAIQFLTTLHRLKMLLFDKKENCWHWEMDILQQQNFTDNIVELMVSKLNRFSQSTRQVLILAAHIGSSGKVDLLSQVSGKTKEQLLSALVDPVKDELLWIDDVNYIFMHDRIQEAVYALLSQDERSSLHLKIGQTILDKVSPEQLSKNIFEMVSHLNKASLVRMETEKRVRFAELNLEAARHAKDITDFSAAVNYCNAGTELLESQNWKKQYYLKFNLQFELAECLCLNGEYIGSANLLHELLAHATSLEDRVRVYRLLQRLYQLSGHYQEATATTFEALRLFDITVPETEADVKEAFECEYKQVLSCSRKLV